MNQMELARLAESTQTTISKVERGEASSSIDIADRIARALGVPLSELFGGHRDGDKWLHQSLTPEELTIIETYRKLGPHYRDTIKDVLEGLLDRVSKRETAQ